MTCQKPCAILLFVFRLDFALQDRLVSNEEVQKRTRGDMTCKSNWFGYALNHENRGVQIWVIWGPPPIQKNRRRLEILSFSFITHSEINQAAYCLYFVVIWDKTNFGVAFAHCPTRLDPPLHWRATKSHLRMNKSTLSQANHFQIRKVNHLRSPKWNCARISVINNFSVSLWYEPIN